MDNTLLQEFVAKRASRRRITFGDVRRLQRDILPDGISNRAEMQLLIDLDGRLLRADSAWTEWLVGIVLDFVLSEDGIASLESEGIVRIEEDLASGTPKLKRRIIRRIRSEVELLAATPQNSCASFVEPTYVEPLPLAA